MKENKTFKIKDDVDLSVLKDFGFEYKDNFNLWVAHIHIIKWDFLGGEYLCVNPDTRIINYFKKPTFDNDLWYCIEYLGINDLVNVYYDNSSELNKFYALDNVNHPKHYNDGKIEVIDFIEDKKLGFCLGNAIKYICRAGKKDKNKEVEDIQKSIWYLHRYLENIDHSE